MVCYSIWCRLSFQRSCDHIWYRMVIEVWDPKLVAYAFEQPEMLRSHDYKHSSIMHNFNVHHCMQASHASYSFLIARSPATCPQISAMSPSALPQPLCTLLLEHSSSFSSSSLSWLVSQIVTSLAGNSSPILNTLLGSNKWFPLGGRNLLLQI